MDENENTPAPAPCPATKLIDKSGSLIDLVCTLNAGHEGMHRDTIHGQFTDADTAAAGPAFPLSPITWGTAPTDEPSPATVTPSDPPDHVVPDRVVTPAKHHDQVVQSTPPKPKRGRKCKTE